MSACVCFSSREICRFFAKPLFHGWIKGGSQIAEISKYDFVVECFFIALLRLVEVSLTISHFYTLSRVLILLGLGCEIILKISVKCTTYFKSFCTSQNFCHTPAIPQLAVSWNILSCGFDCKLNINRSHAWKLEQLFDWEFNVWSRTRFIFSPWTIYNYFPLNKLCQLTLIKYSRIAVIKHSAKFDFLFDYKSENNFLSRNIRC